MAATTVSLTAIRRLTVSTQGYAPRFRRAAAGEVEGAIRRLGAVQLDSISAVDRAHRLTLSSRIGAYPEQELQELLTSGRVFEYWAHEACLLPIELWPHCRLNMEGKGHWRFHETALEKHADLVEPVLARIRAEGPLGSRDFEGAGDGTDMWNWKPAKMVLEALWDRGVLVVAGRQSFQRRYDLAERVIPRAILDAPTPAEDETLRTFALLAVRARGALTEPAIREHWRLKGGRARLHHHVLALVDEGLLREVQVGRRRRAVLRRRRRGAGRRSGPARPPLPLRQPGLGPAAARAVFGFRHVIEVYKREHERAYGYYVLPLLAGDRFVGRADLKADRAEGVLHVAPLPPRAAACAGTSTRSSSARRLRLARVLGLEEVRA